MQNYRFTILGAGLAGLTLSAELSIKSIPHLVIDTGSIGSGASGTPAGLLNPAAAQKARFPVTAPSCIEAFEKLFNIVSGSVDCSSVIMNDHIIRPAIDEKLASNFKESVEIGDWPENWVSWLSSEQVLKFGPISSLGGMFIHKGIAVDFRAWTKALAMFTESNNALIIENATYELISTTDGFELITANAEFKTDIVIDCTGSSDRFKSHLKWHPVKGQTRIVRPNQHIELNTAVSGYGYVVKKGDTLVLGSTYEHQFKDELPSEDKDSYLLKKASMVTTESIQTSQIEERWAGVRVSSPDRLPAIGSLPDNPNFHFILGLGSKGLYYSAWTASMLCDHLLNSTPIPRQYHVSRLLKTENKKG